MRRDREPEQENSVFLEKLEIFGFKSFAERTVVRFSPGITAVVGPNGCGKSNISDAVRWALGEQNVRNLRGRVLQDVIFKGTREVKPLGMAEVCLHLDNESQRLASEYAQVAIRRRAFRSGESDFAINKSPCRLKDIRDLFMDTGLGSSAYAVIEREMIDEVLADRDKSRRFLLDEASGITRYKQRRREALLKLEGVEQDLTRVEDALEIEERDVRSLAYQSGKTRRHRRLSEQIRAIEVALARLHWRELCAAAAGESGRLGEEERAREAVRTRTHQLDAEQEELRVSLLGLARKLEQARAEAAGADEGLAATREEALVLKERIRALGEQFVALQERISQEAEARARAAAEGAALDPRCLELAEALERQRGGVAAVERECAAVEEALRAAREEWARHQQLHIDSLRRDSDVAGRIEAGEERLSDLVAHGEKVNAQIEGLSARAAEIGAWLVETQARYERLQSSRREFGERLAERERALGQAHEDVTRLCAELVAPGEERASAESRRLLLVEQARSYEGFREGVAQLLAAKEELPGVLGAAAELLTVAPEWTERLAPVLHEVAGWVVTATEEAAWDAIAWLRSRGLGQVTFFPLALHEQAAAAAEREAPAGLAAGVLQARAPELEPLARFLRARIVPVSAAVDVPPLARRAPGRRWITDAGEVLAAEGWLSVGGAPAAETRLWRRPEEIAGLAERIAAIKTRCAALEEERARARERAATLEPEIAALRADAEEHRLELENLGRSLLQKEAEERLIREELARQREERERVSARLGAIEQEVGQLARSRAEVRAAGDSTEAEFRAASGRVEERSAEKDRLAERLAERRMEALLGETRLRDVTSRREQCRLDAQSCDERSAEMSAQAQRCTAEQGAAKAKLVALAQAEIDLVAERERRHATVNRHEQERSRLEERLSVIEGDLRAQRRELAEFEEALRQNEVRLARLEAEKEALRARIRDQFLVDLVTLEDPRVAAGEADGNAAVDAASGGDGRARAALRSPEETLGAWTREEALARVEELRGERERLGPVNPLAIEEYEKKRDHVRFIKEQRDDLLASKTSLLEAIERINQEARQLFQATFDAVQANLTQTFETLFPGGEAQLCLTGDDPLEADIEIMARPRGKRLESIHLLSSGEKALTATALLFALYLVKPSPFCLLDEVDAPLDDANIDRFLNLLRSFSDRTQFIVITHNKRSMEVADSLYGVTMQEPGISRVVSVRLEGNVLLARDAAGREAPLALTAARGEP